MIRVTAAVFNTHPLRADGGCHRLYLQVARIRPGNEKNMVLPEISLIDTALRDHLFIS